MRPCTRCPSPVTAKQAVADGDGVRHIECPAPPDRERYLAERAAAMPRLTQHIEMLAAGASIEEIEEALQ